MQCTVSRRCVRGSPAHQGKALVETSEDEVADLLTRNRDKLDALVRALLEHETLDEADAYEVAGVARPPADPSLGEYAVKSG